MKKIKDGGCKGTTISLGLLHHDYHAHQKSCRNPNSFQASLSTKTSTIPLIVDGVQRMVDKVNRIGHYIYAIKTALILWKGHL